MRVAGDVFCTEMERGVLSGAFKIVLDLAWGVNISSFQLSVFTEFVKCVVGSKQELKMLWELPFSCFL